MLCTVIELPNSSLALTSRIRKNYCHTQGKQFSLKPSESCQLQANSLNPELCKIQNSNFKSHDMLNVACLNLSIWGNLKSVLKFKTICSVGYCGENNAILINSSYYTDLNFTKENVKCVKNSYLVQHSLFGDVGSGSKLWSSDRCQHRRCYADGATYIQASQEHLNY